MKGEEADETGAPPEDDAFNAKSPGARAAVAAAGPMINFVLAFVLLLIFNAIYGYANTGISEVEANYPAAQAGLEVGDEIVGLNGESIHVYEKISFLMMDYAEGDSIELVVKKADGKEKRISLPSRYKKAPSGRKGLFHAINYLVPKMRSPASPRPGRM